MVVERERKQGSGLGLVLGLGLGLGLRWNRLRLGFEIGSNYSNILILWSLGGHWFSSISSIEPRSSPGREGDLSSKSSNLLLIKEPDKSDIIAQTNKPRAGWDCAGWGLEWNRLRLWLKLMVVGRERKRGSGLGLRLDLERCKVGEEVGRVGVRKSHRCCFCFGPSWICADRCYIKDIKIKEFYTSALLLHRLIYRFIFLFPFEVCLPL